MAAVEVKNGYKFYGSPKDPNKKIVLNYLNMNVMNGSIYGLLGSSGCGKTTLLSCIVGQKKLHEGSINVLGVGIKKNASFIAPCIGYMPQDIALVEELTIKETIFYFGRIYERMVGKLSGGQKRRVSFACALVHEPELVILDEPTVGLDPILREKIWEFLVETTRTSKLAVIITTHYIEEARQANTIGLMRNGILLAEDTPQNIMTMFNTSTLEDAFLILSQKQGESEEADNTLMRMTNTSESDTSETAETKDSEKLKLRRNKSFAEQKPSGILGKLCFTSKSRMKALLTKNFLQLIRQKAGLLLLFLFPVLQCTCFYLAIGDNPKNLKIGIVNDEVERYEDCFNTSLITTYVHDDTCDLNKVSCRYLSRIPPDLTSQVYYKTVDEAYKEAREASIIGFIHFASNFTESIAQIRDEGRSADDGSFINSEIQIRLDMSNQQVAYFLERKLREIYGDFAQNLMVDCELPKALGSIPIRFETPIYGAFDTPYKDYAAPGVIMTMIFFLATLVTASVFISDRKEGIWDRTLVAGISMPELLCAHILVQSTIVVIQCIELIFYIGFIFETPNRGDNFTVIAMLTLNGFGGMLFGLLISVVCESHTQANFVATGVFYPMIILCGLLWPLEGMPYFLKKMAYTFPFTLPAISVRNVIDKGWPISHPEVYNGFLVMSLWVAALFALCLLALRRHK
ncbi:hypothetical protein HA402_006964 [Bradysia odoriphaga]|nr:hypothetical protein HA402_006964 [Bradysia odoriphaga]